MSNLESYLSAYAMEYMAPPTLENSLRLPIQKPSPPQKDDIVQSIDRADVGDMKIATPDIDLLHTTVDHVYEQLSFALSIPEDNGDKPYHLKHCGDRLLRLFENGQKKGKLLDKALSAYRLAILSLPQGDEIFLKCQNNIALSLLRRFELTGSISDINDAISEYEAVANSASDKNKSYILTSLCVAQARRFERTWNRVDIDRAIVNCKRAVELTAEDHRAYMAVWLNNLGALLSLRFETFGAVDDLTYAISNQQKGLKIIPKGHSMIASLHNNLGISFYHQFQYSGDLNAISNAIVHGENSVYSTPEGDYRLPGRLNCLANSYTDRFITMGDMADLTNAISTQHRVIDLTPEAGLLKSIYLNNLGSMYKTRFQSTKDPKDIKFAITSQQQAIELSPEAHIYLPTVLSNLSRSYLSRFWLDGNPDDISNAVSSAEKAVGLTPPNHPNFASHLNCLGNAYSRRFEHTGNIDDLSNCIVCHERAVQNTPDGHVDQSLWLNGLGKAYLRRYMHSRDKSDLSLAISHYLKSATNISGVPSKRLESAETAARLSQSTAMDSQQAFKAYGIAVDLISRVAGLNQTVQKRHDTLTRISTTTTEAAALAFSIGEYRTALEWLEQGRCLVWNQLNQLRTPLDELFAYDERLANKLLDASRRLEKLGSRQERTFSMDEAQTTRDNVTLEEQSREHVKLAQEWDSILVEVREIAEFKDFLRPRGADDLLRNLPRMGFVILINIHEDRCDALILHSGGDPVHVPLQDFSYVEAEALRDQLHSALELNGVRKREVVDRGTFRLTSNNDSEANSIQNVLSELWKWVAHPILAHIHAIQPLTKRSRIWWCSTGPLVFLPLHAAGIYSEGLKSITSVPSVSISSYVPTVSYLVDSNGQDRRACHRFLLISQPDTPNLPPIPGTRQEIDFVKGSIVAADEFIHNHLDGSQATVDTVRNEMAQYPWIHLACHAIQDTTSPLRSGFYLHDGCLELGEIIKLHIPNADFAFLSACQTSTGDEKLSEEAVHLAAGMLAAGYKGVVSTMWSISDAHGPQLAKEFYKCLLDYQTKAGHGGFAGAAAAYALDYAIRRIRAEVKDTESGLLQWVPYVHFGV